MASSLTGAMGSPSITIKASLIAVLSPILLSAKAVGSCCIKLSIRAITRPRDSVKTIVLGAQRLGRIEASDAGEIEMWWVARMHKDGGAGVSSEDQQARHRMRGVISEVNRGEVVAELC